MSPLDEDPVPRRESEEDTYDPFDVDRREEDWDD